MDCPQIRSLFSEHRHGTLSERDGEFVASHLKECAKCAVEYRQFETTLQWLDELPREPAPPDIRRRVMSRLHEGTGTETAQRQAAMSVAAIMVARWAAAHRRSRYWLAGGGFALAAVAVALVAVPKHGGRDSAAERPLIAQAPTESLSRAPLLQEPQSVRPTEKTGVAGELTETENAVAPEADAAAEFRERSEATPGETVESEVADRAPDGGRTGAPPAAMVADRYGAPVDDHAPAAKAQPEGELLPVLEQPVEEPPGRAVRPGEAPPASGRAGAQAPTLKAPKPESTAPALVQLGAKPSSPSPTPTPAKDGEAPIRIASATSSNPPASARAEASVARRSTDEAAAGKDGAAAPAGPAGPKGDKGEPAAFAATADVAADGSGGGAAAMDATAGREGGTPEAKSVGARAEPKRVLAGSELSLVAPKQTRVGDEVRATVSVRVKETIPNAQVTIVCSDGLALKSSRPAPGAGPALRLTHPPMTFPANETVRIPVHLVANRAGEQSVEVRLASADGAIRGNTRQELEVAAHPAKPAAVPYSYEGEDLRKALAALAKAAGKRLVLAPEVKGKLTGKLAATKPEAALKEICTARGLDLALSREEVRIGPAPRD